MNSGFTFNPGSHKASGYGQRGRAEGGMLLGQDFGAMDILAAFYKGGSLCVPVAPVEAGFHFLRWRRRFFFGLPPGVFAACCFWTLAQVSRRVTMRLKTRASGRESTLSTQK